MTLLTPKQRLLNDPVALAQAKAAITPEVEHFMQVAYADYCMALPGSESPQHGWNANCRRQGALEFMKRFLAFPDAAPEPVRMDDGGLLPEKQHHPMKFPQ